MNRQKLIFEIGTEEIPSGPLYDATKKLVSQTEAALDEARIAHGSVKTCSTPRRIIIAVEDVADTTEALTQRS